MNFFRPLSILGTRFSNFFGWTVDTNSLAQPLITGQKLDDKKKEATGSFGKASFPVQSSFLKSYTPPVYKPPVASFQN